MFQIKDFTSITAAMINHMRGTQKSVTDFNVGSVARTMVEAPAVEIDELYQQAFIGLKEAIPVATYQSFNFERLEPVAASGVVRVVIEAQPLDTVIPLDTVFAIQGGTITYASTSDTTILAGATTADVLVTASAAGAMGNLSAGAVLTITPVPAGFVSATNQSSFLNGRDAETDDERKQRFALFVSTLSRATNKAIEYGAKTVVLYDANGVEIERVQAVRVVEPYLEDTSLPPALVEVYIHNGVGSTSSELIAETSRVLYGFTDASGAKVDGWKAAGARMLILPAIEIPLDVTATVTVAASYAAADVKEAVRVAVAGAIATYMLTLDIGETMVFSDLVHLARSIDGVSDIVFTTPTANYGVHPDEKIMPGTVTITAP